MKRLICFFMICTLCALLFSGCSSEQPTPNPAENSSTPQLTEAQQDPSTTNAPENEVPPTNQDVLVDWKDTYRNVLNEAMASFPNYQYLCNYSIYDIDKDGIPELLLKVGTCEADFEYQLFYYDASHTTAMCFQKTTGSHTSPCGLENEQAFLWVSGHMGNESVIKATYDGTNYSEETLFSGEVEEYHEFTYLDCFELDDQTGLDWSGNATETNNIIIEEIVCNNIVVDIGDPASIEILSVEYTGDPMYPLNVTYKINNIKSVRGCVYLTCDAHAYQRQMFFNDENHTNEYRADGIYDFGVGWLGQGAVNYLTIYYGYGTFDPYAGWSNSCSAKIHYRLVDDHGTISSATIPDEEIYHLYDENGVEVGAWTLHESGDLIEENGISDNVPFSLNNVFMSSAGYTVSVELIDGVPYFTIDGAYIGAPRAEPIEMGTGALFYEIDSDNGTYAISRYPNDSYISVSVMGNLPEALEGDYRPW